jgi:hypothetical protein
MKRRKRARTSRKDFPLSIDLRDFLMYSNPSKFAPKVRRTGGEAYPQAPTMDQFYSYGAPTPQTPFVFQDGGSMSDIQKMHNSYKNHYMKKGGVTSFEDTKPNRANDFLARIKNLAYDAVQRDFENDEMGMQNAYNQTVDQMNYMQYGGNNYDYNMSASGVNAANQWANAASNTADMNKAFGNLGKLGFAYAATPTETYIKSIKPLRTAQGGLNFRDQVELPFNHGSYPISSGMMYGVNAMNPSYGNVMTEDIPGMGTPVNGMYAVGEGYGQGRNLASFDTDAYDSEGPIYPSNPTSGMSRDEALEYWRTKNGTQPMSAEEASSIVDLPGRDPDFMQSKDMHTIREKEEPLQLITPKDLPSGGLRSQYDPLAHSKGIVEKNIDALNKKYAEEEEAKKKKAEEEKKKAAPNQQQNKQQNQQITGTSTTPGQYLTTIDRIGTRRALLPGNRIKYIDFSTYGPGMNPITASANQQKPFFYDSKTGKWEGDVPQNKRGISRGDNLPSGSDSGNDDGGFLSRLFRHKDNYHEPKGNVTPNQLEPQQQINPAGSRFDPRGYNSEYSDWRNQIFQNRRRSLGNKIDRLYAKENERYNLYGQEGSQRDYNKINRLTNRYNRIGEGRTPDVADTRYPDLMWRLINDQRRKPEPFNFGNDYQRPEYKAMGGGMGYFAPGGGIDRKNLQFVTGDPSEEELPQTLTDMQGNQYNNYAVDRMMSNDLQFSDYGTDQPESTGDKGEADLASTYYGDVVPVDLVKREDPSLTLLSKNRMKFGRYNPYEAPMYMAGLDVIGGMGQNLDAYQKQKQLRNKTTASSVFTTDTDMSRGDYTANEGYFRPDQQVPTQFKGYNFKSPYAKMGGSYKKGGEYYLTQDEIDEIIQNGGQVEFLD